MKAALFYGGRDIRVEELPDPTPGPGEVLVKIGAAGVCGSDLHGYRGGDPWGAAPLAGPRRAGHELAGTVAALGSGVTRVAVGQRVGVEPMHLVGCGRCRQCRRGDYHICPRRGMRDGQRHGSAGFSELDLVLEANVYPLPDHVSLDAASLLDVYGCGVHAINRVPLHAMEYVCVVGTGPIGLTMGQVARAAGARKVIMIGRRDEPLQFALNVGAADAVVNNAAVGTIAEAVADLTDGDLCDAVFETVGGETDTMLQAVEAAAFGGRIGVIGAFWRDVAVPYRAGNRKELDVLWCNSYSTWHGQREFQIALHMVADGRVQAEPLVTHRFPLVEIGAAFAAADDKRGSGSVKVVVQP
ncbi:MAG: alcohol dehydrogenase catalytic domain-containing protein [Chloroflexi bacterium]|nr:alcohol dehydrogenase catalytic domain-containing protein [Chloroflexota bacterium]